MDGVQRQPSHDERAQLSVRGLHMGFSVRRRTIHVVRGISLTVTRGRTLAVVGESGCGKSTLAKTICGVYQPTAGQVLFGGIDVHRARGAQLRTVRRDLQLLFQEPLASLNPRLTVRRSLWEPMKAFGLSRSLGDAGEAIADALAAVGLPADAADRYPRSFSGGQQQRIALARLLVVRPSTICADEPVSALDVSIQAQIIRLLQQLQRDHQLSYLLISHDLALVSQVADDVAVMYLGEIVESGSATRVVGDPLHPYTVALRSAFPAARRGVGPRARIVLGGEPPSPAETTAGCPFQPRCPVARSRCAAQKPPLVEQGGRLVACFYPGDLQ